MFYKSLIDAIGFNRCFIISSFNLATLQQFFKKRQNRRYYHFNHVCAVIENCLTLIFWTVPCKLKMRFGPLCKWPWELIRNKILWCAILVVFCFVCLEFFVPLENFSLIWRRHHYRWRSAKFDQCSALMIWYDMHSWPLSSEGSLACHTYWDTGHPFIMVISEDPWHSHLLPSV